MYVSQIPDFMITAFLPLLKHPCFPGASRFPTNAPLRVASAEASPTPLPTGCIYSLKAGSKKPMESTKKINSSTTNSTRNHFVRRKRADVVFVVLFLGKFSGGCPSKTPKAVGWSFKIPHSWERNSKCSWRLTTYIEQQHQLQDKVTSQLINANQATSKPTNKHGKNDTGTLVAGQLHMQSGAAILLTPLRGWTECPFIVLALLSSGFGWIVSPWD